MKSFKESNLKAEIIEAVTDMGFEKPTPIQAECIPFILESENDLIANAQTGTGKTAAFGLPIIHQIDIDNRAIQSIILSPTRELAIQISKDLIHYAAKIPGLKITAVYGGASIDTQLRELQRGVHIVVGTPGRVLDLINRKKLILSQVQWLVLDEADEMLNMGFKDELDGILETTPDTRQTLLFSATLPKEIVRISKSYMHNPQQISVSKANSGADNVEHHYYQVSARDKYAVLKRIADLNPNVYAIVFCRTRHETKDIADKLIRDDYNADSLHGDLSQAQREHVMNRFRSGNLQILVATDVAARGLDVTDLTHVINYSLPDDSEVYVHRSGRTGRAGKNGISISITHTRENRKIRDIENILGKKFTKKLVPSGREICEIQLFNLIDTMQNVDLTSGEIDTFMDDIYTHLEPMSKEDVIKRFVSVEFNRFLDYYKNAKDLNVISRGDDRGDDRGDRGGRRDRDGGRDRGRSRDGDKGSRGERSDRGRGRDREDGERGGREPKSRNSSKMQRFYVNLGSKHQANPGAIIGLINRATPDSSVDIGQIEILKKFSFFEVESKYSKDVLDGINKLSFHDEQVVAEISDKPKTTNAPKEKSSSFDRQGRRTKEFSKDKKSGGKKW